MVRSVEHGRNVRAQAGVHRRHDGHGRRSLGRLLDGVVVDHRRRSAPHRPWKRQPLSAAALQE